MKHKGWLAVTCVAGAVVFGPKVTGGCIGGGGKAPDEKLVKHFEATCEIARANVESPAKGVRKLGRYLAENLGEIHAHWANLIVEIETIPDDEAHDRRARVARDRLRAPINACAGDWVDFIGAVESDPEAAEMVMRAGERLNRTMEIIFDSQQTKLRLRDLPTSLLTRFGKL